MERRKIQLIAGSTYTVSLPKDWVRKNHLKEKSEVSIYEKGDKTLILSAQGIEKQPLNEIALNIDDYFQNIGQALFAIYYIGAENISLFSRKDISKDVKAKIRKTISQMSGTEISYEDKQKIVIRVLLDKSKIEINQIIYRIGLIIELSISSILEDFDMEEITINENEIDRLYHLISKIISLSLVDADLLNSSKIKNVSLIPSYFLIGKKLENIGDNIFYASQIHSIKNFDHKKDILNFIKSELDRVIRYIIGDFSKPFEKTGQNGVKSIKILIGKIKDKRTSDYMMDIVRYLVDIQEEVFIISFYKHLLRD